MKIATCMQTQSTRASGNAEQHDSTRTDASVSQTAACCIFSATRLIPLQMELTSSFKERQPQHKMQVFPRPFPRYLHSILQFYFTQSLISQERSRS